MIIAFILVSCELIVIGNKTKKQVVNIDQTTALGAVYLFKTELDSNNIPAATQVLASPNNTEYSAFEKYELYDDVARIGRMIRNFPITNVRSDSLAPDSYKIWLELDYIKNMEFKTKKIKEFWYITNYTCLKKDSEIQ